jgi:uncharacterized protein (TIGR02217 family)
MSFHEIQFPTAIAFHSSGGPERKTEIVTLGSGFEERNAVWANSRRRYDVGYGVKTLDDLHSVIAFFEARLGRLYAFRFKDFGDFKSCAPNEAVSPLDQSIGTGDADDDPIPADQDLHLRSLQLDTHHRQTRGRHGVRRGRGRGANLGHHLR